jgi:O-antigen/teichoic acid export membrane protein
MRQPDGTDTDGSIHSRVLRGTASNVVGRCINLGVWFVVTPVLVHRLGATEYGLWALVGTIIVYGVLFDFGIGAAVSKYVAEYRARDDLDHASRLVSTALWLYLGIGALAAALSIGLAPFFPDIFNVPPGARSTASWLVVLAGLTIAVELPTSTAYAVLRGLQRYEVINVVTSVGMLLLGTSMVVVVLLGGGVLAVAAVNAPLTLVMQVPMIMAIHRSEPNLRYGWRSPSRELVRTVASFSAALFFINTAERVNTKTDEFVVGGFLPVARVAPYSIARRLAELPQVLTLQFINLLLPLASELEAAGDRRRVRALYVASTRVTLVTFLPLGVGLMVLAKPVLVAWVGHAYAADSNVLVVLVAASLAAMLGWPGSLVLQGIARHRLLAVFAIPTALLNLALSIVLVRSLGVIGVALGTLIALSLQSAFFVAHSLRVNSVRASELMREAWLPAALPVVPMLAVLFGLRALVDPASWLTVVPIGAAGAVAYVATYLWLGASAGERQIAHRLALATLHLGPLGASGSRRR